MNLGQEGPDTEPMRSSEILLPKEETLEKRELPRLEYQFTESFTQESTAGNPLTLFSNVIQYMTYIFGFSCFCGQ